MKTRPIAVIQGDTHYNLVNLEIADKATRMGIAKANELNVPFILNGDTNDGKANLRAEWVKALIETIKTARVKPYINIGNHDLINTKGTEHSLEFLRPYATVIDKISYCQDIDSWIIPYHDDADELREYLNAIHEGATLIMHQGLHGGNMGHYIQDRSALNLIDLASFRTILSHYHARQDIKCGRPQKGTVGLATYIGSPYSTSFSEANDPEKGFSILMDDGSLEFVPTNLRRHVIIEIDLTKPTEIHQTINSNDLVWVKVTGSKNLLELVCKDNLRKQINVVDNFRLELIPTDVESKVVKISTNQNELLDSIIDSRQDLDSSTKDRLKVTWKNLCE